jgi:Bacterial self-protective colicin-like immunity
MNYSNSVLIENLQFWDDRKIYIQLMENFVSEKIDVNQFEREFYRMWQVNLDKNYSLKEVLFRIKDEELKLTELDYFTDLISELFTDCDVFEPDSRFRNDGEISEEQLRDCVKRALLKMKDRYL